MASNESPRLSSPSPHFVFGGTEKKASVQFSSVVSTKLSSHQQLNSSTKPSAKDVLLQVQRDSMDFDKSNRNNHQHKFSIQSSPKDRTVLQKDAVFDSDSNMRPRPQTINLTELNTTEFIPVQQQLENDDSISTLTPQDTSERLSSSSMYFGDTLAQESIMSLNALLNIPMNSPLNNDCSGSPDSGYGNTPDPALKLSTLARNRTSSSETTSSVDSTFTYRTSPSSGVPSSIWSVHESALELVEEENNKEEVLKNGRESSYDEDKGVFPSVLPDDHTQFYHPDDNTLIKVAPRRGIIRTTSLDANRPFEVSLSPTVTPVDEYNYSNGRNRKRNAGRSRSNTMFNKDSNHRHPIFLEEKDTFQIQDELTKENLHFALCDALISVIEEYKSLLDEQAYEEYLMAQSIGSVTSTGLSSPEIADSSTTPPLSPTLCDSPDGLQPLQEMEELEEETQVSSHESRTISQDSSALYSLREVSLLRLVQSPSTTNTAESTAHGLLQYIARVLGGGSQVEFRIPQVIQLPSDFITSIKREEQLQYSVTANSTPIRGGMDWAPPRQQIIHMIHSPANIRDLPYALSNQNNRCAGCGMMMDISQVKFYRFCYYTGKYFCVSCHQNSLSSIPAYIISKWSFKRLPVSNFARDTLAKVEKEPLFNVESLNPNLYSRVPELNRVKELREQLSNMRRYIVTCREAQSLLDQFTLFDHLANGDVHVYSLEDFHMVRTGFLSRQLKSLTIDTERHIKTCILCKGKGFVCEFCKNEDDIIYPFELTRISQCSKCHCCFHKDCYHGNKGCPRCFRIHERQQKRLKTVVLLADEDDD